MSIIGLFWLLSVTIQVPKKMPTTCYVYIYTDIIGSNIFEKKKNEM